MPPSMSPVARTLLAAGSRDFPVACSRPCGQPDRWNGRLESRPNPRTGMSALLRAPAARFMIPTPAPRPERGLSMNRSANVRSGALRNPDRKRTGSETGATLRRIMAPIRVHCWRWQRWQYVRTGLAPDNGPKPAHQTQHNSSSPEKQKNEPRSLARPGPA